MNNLDIMRFILLHYSVIYRCTTRKVLRMLLSAGFFHCKSQKVKGVYSLILREKIKVQTRKLAIDSSKYWFDIEYNDKFADRFMINRG